MKKIIFYLITILTLISCNLVYSQDDRWEYLCSSVNGGEWYIDKNTIFRNS